MAKFNCWQSQISHKNHQPTKAEFPKLLPFANTPTYYCSGSFSTHQAWEVWSSPFPSSFVPHTSSPHTSLSHPLFQAHLPSQTITTHQPQLFFFCLLQKKDTLPHETSEPHLFTIFHFEMIETRVKYPQKENAPMQQSSQNRWVPRTINFLKKIYKQKIKCMLWSLQFMPDIDTSTEQ